MRMIAVIVVGLFSIIASGGGGGGGNDEEARQAIVYKGVTTAAKITTRNANVILSVVLGGGSESLSNIPLSVVAQNGGTVILLPAFDRGHWLRQLVSAVRPIPRPPMSPLGVAVDQTIPGAVSGSSRVVGNLNDDGTGTLTIRFDNFNDGDDLTFDGDLTMQISAYDAMHDLISDMLADIGLLRVTTTGSDISMSGRLRLLTDLDTNTETMSWDVDLRDNLAKKVHRYEGLVLTTTYDSLLNPTPAVVSETVSGRVYVHDEGYVDVTTVSPAQCDGCDEFIPASGGPILLRGDSSEAKVILVSTQKVRIEVDADGDGGHEDFRVYFWIDLTGEPAPNESPVAGAPGILPTAAYTTDDLSVDVSTFSDPDGDPLEFTYTWYKGGSPIADETGATLGASNFVKYEQIMVTVTASDGEFPVSADAPPITILDSPPVLTATPPASAPYDSLTSFVIAAVDADNDTPVFTVQHGPAGLTVDVAGQVSWSPSLPLFEGRVPVQFAIHVRGGDAASTYSASITLEDPARQPPLVRSSLLAPGLSYPDALVVTDFDGDGTDEILLTDTRKLLYILDYQAGVYRQDWVYPFDLPQDGYISAIAAHDFNGDGRPEILIGAGKRLVVLDGLDRRIIAEMESPLDMFVDIEAADIDGDGNPEIVALASNGFQSGPDMLGVYSADGLTTKWQSGQVELGDHLAIGNVDNDAALELVTGGGYVIDGRTYVTEWNRSEGFGTRIDTGDLDNDGIEEIVASTLWDTVSGYDAVTQTRLWQITDQTDSGAVLIVNVDDDPQAEIIVTDGQFGDVTAYDLATGTAVQQWTIDQQGSGVNGLVAGDTDGDGALEIIWTGNQNSTDANSLIVADLLSAAPWIQRGWSNTDKDLLRGPYHGGQWLTVAPNQPRAVFSAITSAPMTRYLETRLVSLDTQTSAVTTSASTGLNSYSYTGVPMDGADVDGDGVDEVFLAFPLPQASNGGGRFSLYDFTMDAISWNSGTPATSNPFSHSIIRHADVNGDGYADFIVLVEDGYGSGDATYLYVHDVRNNQLLWQSVALPGSLAFDLEVADLDGDGALDIVAATATPDNASVSLPSGHLSVFEYDAGTTGFVSRLTQSLPLGGPGDNARIRLTLGNFDGDSQLEIALSTMTWEETGAVRENVVQIRDGVNLSLQAQFMADGPVSDILAAPGPAGRDNLLLATYRDVSLYWLNSINYVQMVDASSGAEIWRSPALIGSVQNNSMSLEDTDGDGASELILGTSTVMYVTR